MNVTMCKIANTLGKRLMANETLYKKTCMTWKIAIKPFKVMKRKQNLKYEQELLLGGGIVYDFHCLNFTYHPHFSKNYLFIRLHVSWL